MEEMTERVMYPVNTGLSNEVARLARELTTANTTIKKMADQLTMLLQGTDTPKKSPATNTNTNINNTNNSNKRKNTPTPPNSREQQKDLHGSSRSCPIQQRWVRHRHKRETEEGCLLLHQLRIQSSK